MDDFTNKEEDEEQKKRSLIKKRTIKRIISPGKRIQKRMGRKTREQRMENKKIGIWRKTRKKRKLIKRIWERRKKERTRKRRKTRE